jgi:peroxin-10
MILRYLLLESLEVFVHYRTLSKYDAEIKMTSDFLYYFLTTIRGKQTLGEEYCSIIPVKANPKQKLKEAFPSLGRRLFLCLLNVLGPYAVQKLLRKFE